MSTTAKINMLIRKAVGKPVRIIWRSSGFSDSQSLRVVTPAWKTLPRPERISKLKDALDRHLNAKERACIFRISVLTPAEFKRLAQVVPGQLLDGKNGANGQYEKVAAG